MTPQPQMRKLQGHHEKAKPQRPDDRAAGRGFEGQKDVKCEGEIAIGAAYLRSLEKQVSESKKKR
jgi:hypothetical protein